MPSQRQVEEWKRRIAHKRRKERERIANDLWDRIKNEPKPQRKLSAGWTVTDMDVSSYYSYQISEDVVKALAEQITKEIDEQALEAITRSA